MSPEDDLKVQILSCVYESCLEHVTIHARQEMMGLLIGELSLDGRTVRIHGSKVIKRLDKRPDRVEVSPEDLSTGIQAAEQLGVRTGNAHHRVLGWYHSHPHITVWPSHVDLRTQANLQTLDRAFIGMIFGIYGGRHDRPEADVICFQSRRSGDGLKMELVRFEVLPEASEATWLASLEQRISLPGVLVQEESQLMSLDLEVVERTFEKADDGGLARRRRTAEALLRLGNIIEVVSAPLLSHLTLEASAADGRGPPDPPPASSPSGSDDDPRSPPSTEAAIEKEPSSIVDVNGNPKKGSGIDQDRNGSEPERGGENDPSHLDRVPETPESEASEPAEAMSANNHEESKPSASSAPKEEPLEPGDGRPPKRLRRSKRRWTPTEPESDRHEESKPGRTRSPLTGSAKEGVSTAATPNRRTKKPEEDNMNEMRKVEDDPLSEHL